MAGDDTLPESFEAAADDEELPSLQEVNAIELIAKLMVNSFTFMVYGFNHVKIAQKMFQNFRRHARNWYCVTLSDSKIILIKK